jgi:uncharacterized protein (DUF433 family)
MGNKKLRAADIVGDIKEGMGHDALMAKYDGLAKTRFNQSVEYSA